MLPSKELLLETAYLSVLWGALGMLVGLLGHELIAMYRSPARYRPVKQVPVAAEAATEAAEELSLTIPAEPIQPVASAQPAPQTKDLPPATVMATSPAPIHLAPTANPTPPNAAPATG